MWWTTAGENRPMRSHHSITSVYLHKHFEHDAEEGKKSHSEHAASVRTQQYHHSERAESWADYWSLIIDSSQRHRRERETARTCDHLILKVNNPEKLNGFSVPSVYGGGERRGFSSSHPIDNHLNPNKNYLKVFYSFYHQFNNFPGKLFISLLATLASKTVSKEC